MRRRFWGKSESKNIEGIDKPDETWIKPRFRTERIEVLKSSVGSKTWRSASASFANSTSSSHKFRLMRERRLEHDFQSMGQRVWGLSETPIDKSTSSTAPSPFGNVTVSQNGTSTANTGPSKLQRLQHNQAGYRQRPTHLHQRR